jgi:serine/threonine-protein kinase MRCK
MLPIIIPCIATQVQLVKDKLDAARLEELTDSEEAIAELKRRHEREKLLLLEDNKKLMMDLDSVSVNFFYLYLI